MRVKFDIVIINSDDTRDQQLNVVLNRYGVQWAGLHNGWTAPAASLAALRTDICAVYPDALLQVFD